MRNLLAGSKIIFFLRAICDKYASLKIYIARQYGHSYIHSLIEKSGVCFKHSFLSAILDKISYQEDGAQVFNNSRSVKFLLRLYNSAKCNIVSYFKKSVFWSISRDFSGIFYSAPLRASGIILTFAISTKFLLEAAINRKISHFNASVSTFFLLLGLACLVSRADWVRLKKSSHILKS